MDLWMIYWARVHQEWKNQKREKRKTNSKEKGLLLGKNSPFNSIPILRKFFEASICRQGFDKF